MQREILNLLRLDNGFLLTSYKSEATYCADEEAVANFVRVWLAKDDEERRQAAEKAKFNSALTAEEYAALCAEMDAKKEPLV